MKPLLDALRFYGWWQYAGCWFHSEAHAYLYFDDDGRANVGFGFGEPWDYQHLSADFSDAESPHLMTLVVALSVGSETT